MNKGEQKKFLYFQLLDEQNICNQQLEKKRILANIENGRKTVLYGPRNFGKTSLMKNSVIPAFKKKQKNSFVFFADLFEVKNNEQLSVRILKAFERSFAESFPVKGFLEQVKTLVMRARPEISIDPVTSLPSLSVKFPFEDRQPGVDLIFQLIRDISQKVKTLVVIDEFQDIAFVDGAQAVFRNAFESCADIPVVLLGSKKHLLSRIFSQQDSPLAFWGEDIEFKPIDYRDYHAYISERFDQKEIRIDYETAVFLQDLLWRIPEPVNIVASHIYDNNSGINVTKELVQLSLKAVLDNRESRYERHLASLSSAEELVCAAMAKKGSVAMPQGKDFVRCAGLTARSIGKIVSRLMDRGVIEQRDSSYRVADPLLNYYLLIYR